MVPSIDEAEALLLSTIKRWQQKRHNHEIPRQRSVGCAFDLQAKSLHDKATHPKVWACGILLSCQHLGPEGRFRSFTSEPGVFQKNAPPWNV